MLEVNSMRPLESVRLIASESLAIRLMRSPTWLRSWNAIDISCRWVKRPARISDTNRWPRTTMMRPLDGGGAGGADIDSDDLHHQGTEPYNVTGYDIKIDCAAKQHRTDKPEDGADGDKEGNNQKLQAVGPQVGGHAHERVARVAGGFSGEHATAAKAEAHWLSLGRSGSSHSNQIGAVLLARRSGIAGLRPLQTGSSRSPGRFRCRPEALRGCPGLRSCRRRGRG